MRKLKALKIVSPDDATCTKFMENLWSSWDSFNDWIIINLHSKMKLSYHPSRGWTSPVWQLSWRCAWVYIKLLKTKDTGCIVVWLLCGFLGVGCHCEARNVEAMSRDIIFHNVSISTCWGLLECRAGRGRELLMDHDKRRVSMASQTGMISVTH